MPSTSRTKIPEWLRSDAFVYAIRETIIVTVGILIAFALNAWWENHKEAREEAKHVRALASDFSENLEQLKRHVQFEDEIASAGLAVLKMPRGAWTTDELAKTVGRLFSSQRFQPVMGGYEALVNSAGLTLISDETLRTDLAEFAASVNDPYGERISDDMYFAFVREFVGKLKIEDFVLEKPFPQDAYSELLADQRFRDFVALRILSERDVGRYYRELLKTCERIKMRLDANQR